MHDDIINYDMFNENDENENDAWWWKMHDERCMMNDVWWMMYDDNQYDVFDNDFD